MLKEAIGGTEVTLEWNTVVDKMVIRLLSPIANIAKLLFRSNHSWTMRHGERQLIEYLAARKGGAKG